MFDQVLVPHERVIVDGDLAAYNAIWARARLHAAAGLPSARP